MTRFPPVPHPLEWCPNGVALTNPLSGREFGRLEPRGEQFAGVVDRELVTAIGTKTEVRTTLGKLARGDSVGHDPAYQRAWRDVGGRRV